MRQVKGAVLLPCVKEIRADKSGEYERLLNQKVKEEISKMIIVSSWYDFNTYKDCFNAIVEVEARGDKNMCREWGRVSSDMIMMSVYKNFLIKGALKLAMDQFKFVYKSMFNFGILKNEFVSNNEMIFTIEEFDKDFELYYYVILGWMEKYMELCLGKKVQSNFTEKS